MNVAAVIRLLAMHGAAVAEKAFVGIGVDTGIVDHEHAGIFKPPADQPGEIEQRMAIARRGQEVNGVVGIGLDEPFDEFGADLVGMLTDQRADRGHDVGPIGAKFLHRRHGGFNNSRQCALPSCMCRANYPGVGIGKEKGAAVGRCDADRKTFGACDDSVRLGTGGGVPWR